MDNHFKDKLKRYKVEWDKDQLWEELEPQLPKRTSRFWNYWWVLIPLLLIPTCWGELSELKKSTTAAEQTTLEESTDQHSAAIITKQDRSGQALDETPAEAEKVVDHATQRPEIIAPPDEVIPPTMSTSFASPVHAVSMVKDMPLASQRRSRSSLAGPPSTTKNIKQLTTLKHNAARKSSNARALTPAAVVAVDAGRAVQPIEKLPLELVASPANDIPKMSNLSSPPSTEPIAKTLQTKGLFVNVLGGVGALQRKVDFTTLEPVDIEQVSIHKNREAPQFAWSRQLEIGYRHRSGWSVSGGLGHNQLHERLSYDAVIRADTIIETSNRARYFVKASGDTLFLSGPVVSTEVETRRIRHNNQLAFYQIPFSIGYYYPKGRLGIAMGAGVNYLFQQQYRGRISEGEPVEIIDNPGFTLKSHWGYHMRLGLQYGLFNSTHLYLGAQYFRSPEFIRGEVSQRYSSYGVQIGLQHRL